MIRINVQPHVHTCKVVCILNHQSIHFFFGKCKSNKFVLSIYPIVHTVCLIVFLKWYMISPLQTTNSPVPSPMSVQGNNKLTSVAFLSLASLPGLLDIQVCKTPSESMGSKPEICGIEMMGRFII